MNNRILVTESCSERWRLQSGKAGDSLVHPRHDFVNMILFLLTALLLAPLAWESALGEDTTEMRCVNNPAKSSNP